MLGFVMLLLFVVPLVYFTFASTKKLVLYVLLVGGIPVTTFMPNLIFLKFLGGISPQAILLFFMVCALSFVVAFTNRVFIRELLRFNIFTIFIVYVFLSLIWSDNLIYGLRFSIKLIAPFLLYVAFISVIKDKTDFDKVENAILGCVLVVLFLTAINFATNGAIGGATVKNKWIPLGVITAPYMSPANFSFFISIAAIFSIGSYLYFKKNKYVIAYIVLAAIVFFAFTRIAMAGLVFASGICVFILIKNNFFKYVIPVIVILGFVVMLFTVDKFRDRMFFNADEINLSNVIDSPASLEKHIDTSGRLYLWASALDHFKDTNIIVGSGVGSVDYFLVKKHRSSPIHNEYLRLYLDLGVIGLTLYLLALLQIGLKLLSIRKNNKSKPYSAIAIGSLACYMVTLFTDNSLNYVTEFGNYVYAFIGLAISSSINISTNSNNSPGSPQIGLIQNPAKKYKLKILGSRC